MGTVEIENIGIQEDEGLGWGNSIPVPSVKEMVRNESQNVPEKYIQDYKDRPLDSNNTSPLSTQIPLIDFSLLANGDEDERKKLDFACKEWGFFQIINHGVANKVLHGMKTAAASFFELAVVEKMKYAAAANDIEGYGQSYVVSDEQKLDWNDSIFLMTLPPHNRNIKYWPTTVPGFKEAVENYCAEIERVTQEIFGNMSVLMGMEKESLKNEHGGMNQAMRMNYYPTCVRPDLVIGVSPHSDASSITLLLQDDHITGLQIKHKGRWVPVNPISNAIVVNIGDVMEAWSNGVYKSIEHRAVTNEAKPRMSVATFVLPDEEMEIGPLETMMDDYNHPRMYKNIKYIDYIRYTLARRMDGKTNTQFLKLGNE